MEPIDAEAAVAALRIYEDWRCPATNSAIGAIQEAISIIAHEVPTLTLDDLRPKGRWIAQDETLTKFMCSVCESKNYGGYEMFCPNCGADLRGGQL